MPTVGRGKTKRKFPYTQKGHMMAEEFAQATGKSAKKKPKKKTRRMK